MPDVPECVFCRWDSDPDQQPVHRAERDGHKIGWNCGPGAGQEIMHAHMHVIPRFKDEPYAGRGIRFWLKQEANGRNPDLAANPLCST